MLICHWSATLLEFIRPETRIFTVINTAIFKIRQLIVNDSESLNTVTLSCLFASNADLVILLNIFGREWGHAEVFIESERERVGRIM